MSSEYQRTDRTKVKRISNRGSYDKDLIHGVIDESLICHVGFVVDGQPYVIPTIHTRIDDRLYFHGALANRMLRSLESGFQACVTMTIIDGIVFAKSVFHHSMNYRSVVVLGTAELVTDKEEKDAALHALVEHVAKGRSSESRPPNASELRATLVVKMNLEEVSAKVRTGPPIDEEEDSDLPYWSGILPLSIAAGAPESDELSQRLTPSSAITDFSENRRRSTPA